MVHVALLKIKVLTEYVKTTNLLEALDACGAVEVPIRKRIE